MFVGEDHIVTKIDASKIEEDIILKGVINEKENINCK